MPQVGGPGMPADIKVGNFAVKAGPISRAVRFQSNRLIVDGPFKAYIQFAMADFPNLGL
jgi:hypothetical protein